MNGDRGFGGFDGGFGGKSDGGAFGGGTGGGFPGFGENRGLEQYDRGDGTFGQPSSGQPSFGGADTPGFPGFTADPMPSTAPPRKNNGGKKAAIGVAAVVVVLVLIGLAGIRFLGDGGDTIADGGNASDGSPGVSTEIMPDEEAGTGSGDIDREPENAPPLTPAPGHDAGIPPAENDSAIAHTSQGWEWLENPGGIVPGGRIVNATKSTECSVGYLTHVEKRVFVLTAGHCGEVGDEFHVSTPEGEDVHVGQMVESEYLVSGQEDYGLIEITNPNVALGTFPTAMALVKWEDINWIEKNRPRICRLGYRTGLSCGAYLGVDERGILQFRGYVDHGDSGGPVFAETDEGLVAVGINSYRQPDDATRVGAMTIAEPMNLWSLGIFR